MGDYRIMNISLASAIDEGFLSWLRYISPITMHYLEKLKTKKYHGKRLAYWGHLTAQNLLLMFPALQKAGAEKIIGACHLDRTDDASAAYVASLGIPVYGWRGMSQKEYDENLRYVRRFEADFLCDMGGELSEIYLNKHPPVIGALEATTSGLSRLKKLNIPFPVFDWNSIPLKDQLENRFHVGDTVWPVFCDVTGIGLAGRRVLVVGFGPVGKGIAERARSLGANVYVADLDPVKLIEARHYGCEPIHLNDGIRHCRIIVTATGVERVIRKDQLLIAPSGTIFFNAGHSNHEIDINWLYSQPNVKMTSHIEKFLIGKSDIYLLAKGSLLNLAAGASMNGMEMFDHYIAVMLRGIMWMFEGIPDLIKPGLQLYPSELEQEIAEISVMAHTEN
jgi:adenosylhomocysteinase